MSRSSTVSAIRARRKRPDDWPQNLDRETGWIRPTEPGPPKRVSSGRVSGEARKSIGEVLNQVALQAGCSVAALRQRVMGPGANPARRLAVWALSRAQGYSHGEIAAALRMSEGQVAKVLHRLRHETPRAPLSDWMVDLSALLQVESGRV
jgi:DNA-directed RNA polymerase specialized sigma24 family protein